MTPRPPLPATLALDSHHQTRDWSDSLALGITRGLRFLADTFFAKRYGNRAIVLETVAAVPGMVGAAYDVNHGYAEQLRPLAAFISAPRA